MIVEPLHTLSATELLEGVIVSVLFVAAPVVTHAEARHRKREREAERRHAELLSKPPEVQ